MARPLPKSYTCLEGGPWLQWTGGHIGESDFRVPRLGVKIRARVMGGRVVHSFLTARGRRWDCINGWAGKVKHG